MLEERRALRQAATLRLAVVGMRYDTKVAVSNLDNSKRPDPSLFKIDYTRYIQ